MCLYFSVRFKSRRSLGLLSWLLTRNCLFSGLGMKWYKIIMTHLAWTKTGVVSFIFWDQEEWRQIDQMLVPFLRVVCVSTCSTIDFFFSGDKSRFHSSYVKIRGEKSPAPFLMRLTKFGLSRLRWIEQYRPPKGAIGLCQLENISWSLFSSLFWFAPRSLILWGWTGNQSNEFRLTDQHWMMLGNYGEKSDTLLPGSGNEG